MTWVSGSHSPCSSRRLEAQRRGGCQLENTKRRHVNKRLLRQIFKSRSKDSHTAESTFCRTVKLQTHNAFVVTHQWCHIQCFHQLSNGKHLSITCLLAHSGFKLLLWNLLHHSEQLQYTYQLSCKWPTAGPNQVLWMLKQMQHSWASQPKFTLLFCAGVSAKHCGSPVWTFQTHLHSVFPFYYCLNDTSGWVLLRKKKLFLNQ